MSYGGLKAEARKPAVAVRCGIGGRSGEREGQLSKPDSVDWVHTQQLVHRPLTAGEEYIFSAWLKADRPAEVDLYLAAVPAVAGMRHQGRRVRRQVGTSWERCQIALHVNDDTKYVKLRCVIQLYTQGATLSIDDASLRLTGSKGGRTVTSAVIGCVWTDTAPVIDGEFDDAVWQKTDETGGFLRLRGRPGGEQRRAGEQTAVRLLYDRDCLYLALRCLDSEMGSVRRLVTVRDGPVWTDDCIEIFLGPERSEVLAASQGLGEYFHLIVSVAGIQADGIGFDNAWDGRWLARTARRRGEWTVEVSIPFVVLGVHPKEGDFWSANFCRHEARLEEYSSWSTLDESFHEQKHFGKVGFVRSASVAKLIERDAVRRAAEEIRQRHIGEMATMLDQIQRAREDAAGERTPGPPVTRLASELDRLTSTTKQAMSRLQGEPPEELIQKQELVRNDCASLQRRCAILCNRAWAARTSFPRSASANGVYAAFAVAAITDRRILPHTNVQGRSPAQSLSLAACRGEREPVSFVVVGSRDLRALEVSVSPLKCGRSVVPANCVDLKLVKCWYQSARRKLWEVAYLKPKGKTLVPELLLNDSDLVVVDLEAQTNAVRVLNAKTRETVYMDITRPNADFERVHFSQIRDAQAIQPVHIPAGHCQQYWLTICVPESAEPDTYAGAITLTGQNVPSMSLPLQLVVYPFELSPPVIETAIYTTSRLGREEMLRTNYIKRLNGRNPFNHYWSKYHYGLALTNMRQHGVDAPLFCVAPYPERSMSTAYLRSLADDYARMLDERQYPRERFFYQYNVSDVVYPGLKVPFANYWRSDRKGTEKRFKWIPGLRPRAAVHLNYREQLKEALLDFKGRAGRHGFKEFWFYFADEIMKNELKAICPYLDEYKKAGLKLFCCTSTALFVDEKGRLDREFWEMVTRAVDGIVFSRKLDRTLADLARKAGVRLYSYNNPQLGVEYPHTYRRNYGLALWTAGYSGGMDFCYTGNDWNDFNNAEYRDHNMVYPSADRMIDTIQWEGYREGVDDVRYLSTLLRAIEEAKKGRGALRRRAREAEEWVRSIKVTDTLGWDGFRERIDDVDLDKLRREMAQWVIALSVE